MFQCVARILQKGTLLTGKPANVVRQHQLAAMHEATQFGVRRVKERTPQGVSGAQGGLISTIQPEVSERGGNVIGIIGTSSRYGLPAEKGRRAGKGMPPEGTLVRWIEVKMGMPADEARRIEFVIRRKIAQKGTKGAHMFEKTVKEDWPEFAAIFRRHGVAMVEGLSS